MERKHNNCHRHAGKSALLEIHQTACVQFPVKTSTLEAEYDIPLCIRLSMNNPKEGHGQKPRVKFAGALSWTGGKSGFPFYICNIQRYTRHGI